MRRILPFILLFFITNYCFSQINFIVNIKNNERIEAKSYLVYETVNQEKILIDTATVSNNYINFKIPDSLNNRLLTLGFFGGNLNQAVEMPLVCSDDKTIEFEIKFPEIMYDCNVVNSASNKILYYFFQQDHILQQKIRSVETMLELYSEQKTGEFYKLLEKEHQNLELEEKNFINQYYSKNNRTQADNFIKHQLEMYTGNYEILSAQNEDLFLKSPLFYPWVWTYLNKFTNQQLSKNEQVSKYIEAVDNLSLFFVFYHEEKMSLMKVLANEMEKAGYDEVSLYIFDYIISPELCEPDSTIIVKAECLKKIQIGKQAPEIYFEYDIGINSMYEIGTSYTLLIFWASWCEHCRQIIPEIKNLYESQKNSKNFEVLAVSIDNDQKEW